MTTMARTRTVKRPPSTLSCQRVGGCSAGVTITAISVVGLLVATSLFCVWSRTETVRQGYAMSEVAGEIRKLSEESEALRAEVARLKSPDRIETIATAGLGMQFPSREQIRVVDDPRPEVEAVALAKR